MAKLNDLKLTRFTLLQTAQSGSGKTTRALTATRFGKLYLMDLDGKAQGASRNIPATLSVNADLVDADSFDSIDASLDKLKELVTMGKDLPYATVCLDTFTALNEMAYIKFMGSNLEKGIKADFDIWGKIDSFLLHFFNLLFSLPCNIIVNAHVAESEDEVTKRTKYAQAGRGGFRTKLPNRFTDSHYLVFQFDKYQVRVKNSDTLPVNTSIDPKLISKDGMATINDLSIFDAYAIKKP